MAGRKKPALAKKELRERAKRIRLLLLDVDGVLTDGRITYDDTGREWKSFDIKDGQGIKLLQRAGLEVGILSGRRSAAVARRARELGIRLLRQEISDKGSSLAGILRRKGLEAAEVCYIGDDLADLPVLNRVGLALAVPDGVPEVKFRAAYITRCPGGRGAVREVCEMILKFQGKWAAVVENFLSSAP